MTAEDLEVTKLRPKDDYSYAVKGEEPGAWINVDEFVEVLP